MNFHQQAALGARALRSHCRVRIIHAIMPANSSTAAAAKITLAIIGWLLP